jgi:NitT/TauT family transport system permease protein
VSDARTRSATHTGRTRDSLATDPGRRSRSRGVGLLRGLIGVAVFLLAWEAIGRAGIVDRSYLPPSSDILRRMADLAVDAGFLRDVAATLAAWASGLLIAAAVAVPSGLVLGGLPWVSSAVRILVEFLRPIPGVALIPLAILLIPDQAAMERSLVAYAATWPILINTSYAVGEVDPVARDTARSFGLGRLALVTRVVLPSAAPFVATGVRVAAGIGLIVVVSTELLAGGGQHGIGTYILQARNAAVDAGVVYAAVAYAGLIGYLADVAMRSAERRLFRWHFARLAT